MALIVAIMVTALVTVVAVSMIARQHLDLRRTGNLLENDQAYIYALAVEQWASHFLIRDDKDKRVDHRGENWATEGIVIPFEEAVLQGVITDLDGLFNVNTLLNPTSGAIDAAKLSGFERLLDDIENNLEADEEFVAMNIGPAVADWLDADDTTRPGGAEDLEYLNLRRPYRAANQAIKDITELRLISGVTREDFQKMMPYISALPMGTPINVNTAPYQVLMTLQPEISATIAQELVVGESDEPYESTADFDAAVKEKIGKQVNVTYNQNAISVGSQYFMVTTVVDLGRVTLKLNSLLYRNQNQVTTISREIGRI